MKDTNTNEKILLAEVKDFEGVKMLYPLEKLTDWSELREQIDIILQDEKTLSVKFYYRTKKWFKKVPEYEG
jgi:hypothetical protein